MFQGFNALTEALTQGLARYDMYLELPDWQRLPILADEKALEVESLTAEYHKYKRGYVKHLSFNPDEKNLRSKEGVAVSNKYYIFGKQGAQGYQISHSDQSTGQLSVGQPDQTREEFNLADLILELAFSFNFNVMHRRGGGCI